MNLKLSNQAKDLFFNVGLVFVICIGVAIMTFQGINANSHTVDDYQVPNDYSSRN